MAEILTRGKFERPPHIDYINERLVGIARGEISRLAVALPPGHGKSFLVSNWQPVWRLALDPTIEIGIASYNFQTAREFSKDIKRLVELYLPELGIEIEEDSEAGHHWRTRQGGRVMASGIDGSFISQHFHLIIIDDPVKGADQAESLTIKDSVWEWYRKVVLSRLRPGGAIVLVQTRWAIDDLMGRILALDKESQDDHLRYRLVSLPVPAEPNDPLGREPGSMLWDKVLDQRAFDHLKIAMGSYGVAALYSQRPVPFGGGMIRHAFFNYWIPSGLSEAERIEMGLGPVVVDGRHCRVVELPVTFDPPGPIQSWDMNFYDEVRAVLHGRQPDPVAGHVWGMRGPDFFLIDRFHERCGINGTIAAVRELTARNPDALLKLVEYTANGPTVIAKLRDSIGGFVPATPVGKKVARVAGAFVESGSAPDREARAITMFAAIEAGNFFLPHPNLPRVGKLGLDFRDNLGLFPKAGRDDADAASQAWRRLSAKQWRDVGNAQREAAREDQQRGPASTHDLLRQHMQRERERVLEKPDSGVGPFHIWSDGRSQG